MTKGLYCPYHRAMATFFLKTLKKEGFPPLKRVIVMTIVTAIADLVFCMEVYPSVVQRQYV